VPGWLRRELAKGLRAEPALRHAGMDQLLHALERGPRLRLLRWIAPAALAALLVAAGIAVWATRQHRAAGRQSAAVVGPRDLSPQPGASFISGALGELLATELEADPQLRLVSPRAVAPALVDLGAAQGAAIDAVLAHRLQQRLDAQLVLGGTYRLDGRELHVSLSLWGKGDEPLFTAEESGPQEGLVPIARQLGARLRKSLGGSGDLTTSRAQGSFPGDAEAARLYVLGVSQLRAYDPGAAIESLHRAEKLAPDNPRIESALAEANLTMNTDVPAREAAARAFAHKDELPPEDAARLEILRERALRNRDQAIALAKAFWAQAPDDAERGQELALLQVSLKDFAGAFDTVAELHKRGSAGGPQTDIIEAQVAIFTADLQRAAAAAQRAYDQALKIGARHEMALSCYWQGSAMRRLGKDPEGALAKQREAEQLFRQSNDLAGAVLAGNQQAVILADAGDLPSARTKFEESLATFRRLGDRADEGKTLHNLSIVLRRMRDLPGAIARSREAQTLFLEIGDKQAAANVLATLGHLRQDLGDLPGALGALEESARLRRELKDPMVVTALQGLSITHLLMGDLRNARRYLQEGRAVGGGALQEKQHSTELDEAEAELALIEGKLAEAEAAARDCTRLAADMHAVDQAALCEALIANVLLRQGKVRDARAAVDRGMALVSKSRNGIARGDLLVMDGRVKAAENDPKGALETLDKALAEATQEGVADDQWQARLALAELAPARSRAMVQARLRTLSAQARAQGFGLYALYADSAARR
ncbi:MAG TPA: tetratricopeptide repeat protein, partial [Myxococcales bacterium]|nr:tetratricopeptide repeat protein [Myxococcales bacterium]